MPNVIAMTGVVLFAVTAATLLYFLGLVVGGLGGWFAVYLLSQVFTFENYELARTLGIITGAVGTAIKLSVTKA